MKKQSPAGKRPRTNPEDRIAEGKRRISYLDDDEQWEKLQKIADSAHTTSSAIIREAVRRFVEEAYKNKAIRIDVSLEDLK